MRVRSYGALIVTAVALTAAVSGIPRNPAEARPGGGRKAKIRNGAGYRGSAHSSAVEGLESVPTALFIDSTNGSTFRGRLEINGVTYTGSGKVSSTGRVTFSGFH